MTKSEIFKAAHKLAKAHQKLMSGDYVVYLARAIRNVYRALKKGYSLEQMATKINDSLRKLGITGSCSLKLRS